MTAQDEVRLKELFGRVHVLIEDLQKQINELKDQVADLQKPAAPTQKKTKVEEPTTSV